MSEVKPRAEHLPGLEFVWSWLQDLDRSQLIKLATWKREARAAVPHNLVSDREYLEIFNNARNGSDKPSGALRGIRAVIAAYENATPPTGGAGQ